MITEKELELLREKVLSSSRPLFFFDDDTDGIASFLLLYKLSGDGKGVCVKGKPVLEESYARKVDEFMPDRVFVLDKPMIEQEFLDKVSQEVVWLDHHPVQDNKNVIYLNPRKNDPDDDKPTSYWAYQAVKDDLKNSLWMAMVGVLGDWNMSLADEFRKEYPDLLPKNISEPDRALFNSKIGLLVKIINFNLKGSTSEVMKSVKILTRIESPYEILDQSTPKGKFIYKKYLAVNEHYEALKGQVSVTNDKLVLFKYNDSKLAISSDLSNELLYMHPDKIIIIAREKSDEIVMSLRSASIKISGVLEKALEGINGYGGGHVYSCGACVKKESFEEFLERFREQLDS